MLMAYGYLAWYVAGCVALVSHTARERFADVLTYLAQGIGEKVLGGFKFDATNEELASAANVTAFSASRLLSEWQDNGDLLKRRGRVLLRFPEVSLSLTLAPLSPPCTLASSTMFSSND